MIKIIKNYFFEICRREVELKNFDCFKCKLFYPYIYEECKKGELLIFEIS